MTTEPTTVPAEMSPLAKRLENRQASALEDLFLLGYKVSDPVTIYKDDNVEIIVVLRTLTPPELREVSEAVEKFSSSVGRFLTDEFETLARAIVTINGMPLVLSIDEREEYFRQHHTQPSPLEMARIILHDKIKSDHVLELMYETYQEFVKSIQQSFDEVKKKLSVQNSSS